MNNKKQHARTLLGLAILGGLMGAGSAQAGGFATPTFGAEGWGRAFGGGSMFKDDPSAAYNNPAAMAFIDHNIAQFNIDYARINIKYKGTAKDYMGKDPSVTTFDPDGNTTSVPRTGDGGQGGFTAWLPTGFMVMPIGDRFAFGLSQVVPMGARTTWDDDWIGRDFAVDTRIETVGVTGSLSFKVNDQFSIGGGAIVQHTKGFVSQNIDLYAAAGSVPDIGVPFPSGVGHSLMRVKVDNTSVGWFAGLAWKPTPQDTLGLNYHAKIKNKLEGKYSIYSDPGSKALIDSGLPGLLYPGLSLNSDGANASTQLDIPANASFDWVHQFNDRLTLGASVTWTQWSSFKDLTLKSEGSTIVSIPYNYKDAWMVSLGGDYKLTDDFTLRAGVATDQTPTRNSTRDPRIPDGDRIFTSLGFGYKIRAIPGLGIDGSYSHQFVEKAKLQTHNQDRLGGATLDGKADAYGDVVSLGMTYEF
ncbi:MULTISPECIES: outer membrane protein transport protein [unclassified Pseudomonas]|jgi:long-chain fatty acid transport protein|uniref:outer membrane protein transport protein n=1 Tax=unclassified Pseudomonas TaxID=196821 RepID=UPI0015A240A4|nr:MULTISPECIES: outer membrane protein transport protein [unclassified Pseudomonas]MDQ0668786.1 long-chain fatty acid transport protein [Pseudomonas sp. W2I6]NVZ34869.1 outer membrane protein transport protein [Pseudomonas sp. A4002]NWB55640.1 outer membrane protein transport protein [Pseudomonas sp. F8002]NWB77608.1 outer membrane protein transport protein [Pseudomonas sp. F9001]